MFKELCENILELEAVANCMLPLGDVCMFSLRNHKPFGEKLPCGTLKISLTLDLSEGLSKHGHSRICPLKKRGGKMSYKV